MRGRPFRVEWRAEDTPEALKARYQAERDGKVRTRLHALWLLRIGWKMAEVASAVGSHYRTVQDWVVWYRSGGLEEVAAHKQAGKGQPSFLSAEQQRELVEQVSTGRFRTAGEIRDWIEAEWGVSYSLGSVYHVLRRLGCSRRVPRPRHEKADAAGQRTWKKGGSGAHSQRRG